jgi:tetratricopeptide (TPR) repeat protein
MRHIFKLIVSSTLLFLLLSFRTEVCKAQVPEAYSVPSSDTTSVLPSPIPGDSNTTPKKKKHHKNNVAPVADTLSGSATGTNKPDSTIIITKPEKKKHHQKSDSTSKDISSVSATGTNKPDSVVIIKKASRKKKNKEIMSDSLHQSIINAKDTPVVVKNKALPVSPPPAAAYIQFTPEQQAASIIETGNKLQGNGDFKTAALMFDSVINYYPKTFYYKYAFYYRGQSDALAGKKDESIKDLSTFIALDSCQSPYCSDAYYMRALVYFHLADFNAAISDFNFVAGHDSTYKNLKFAYFYRAFCYGQQNVFPKAIQDLTKFILIDNMRTAASADALDSRAIYKIKLNDNRGAIQDYDKAATLYLAIIQNTRNAKEEGYVDKLVDTYTQRGLAKAGINKFDEAVLDYSLALKYNPDYAKAYLLRGLAYIGQNKQDLGCLDLSHAGELGATEAYDEIKKYCK